jgi:hypothetical protein
MQWNDPGKDEDTDLAYRFFFFTYLDLDKPDVSRVPSLHGYYIGRCVNDVFHWHGMLFTTVHYRQTFVHSCIHVLHPLKLDVQACYENTKRPMEYIEDQTPVSLFEKFRTDVYGDWRNNFDTEISMEPQKEGYTNPRLSSEIGDLPYYGQYNPRKELAYPNRWRFNKRYYIQFATEGQMTIYMDYLKENVFTEKDFFEVQLQFDYQKYQNEMVVYLTDHNFYRFDVLYGDMAGMKRKNNIFLLLLVADDLVVPNFTEIKFNARQTFVLLLQSRPIDFYKFF